MAGGPCPFTPGLRNSELEDLELSAKGALPQLQQQQQQQHYQQHHPHLQHLHMPQQQLAPVRTILPASAHPGQEATSSRSTLSEADTFEPGSGTACSSPTTPPCSPPAYPGSPPSAPRKISPGKLAPRYTGEAAKSLLGPLPTRRTLLPAFDAVAAAQEGAPSNARPSPPQDRLDVSSAPKRASPGHSGASAPALPKRTRRDTGDESQDESD